MKNFNLQTLLSSVFKLTRTYLHFLHALILKSSRTAVPWTPYLTIFSFLKWVSALWDNDEYARTTMTAVHLKTRVKSICIVSDGVSVNGSFKHVFVRFLMPTRLEPKCKFLGEHELICDIMWSKWLHMWNKWWFIGHYETCVNGAWAFLEIKSVSKLSGSFPRRRFLQVRSGQGLSPGKSTWTFLVQVVKLHHWKPTLIFSLYNYSKSKEKTSSEKALALGGWLSALTSWYCTET